MAKSANAGGCALLLILGFLAMLAAMPKLVWVGFGVAMLIGTGIYLSLQMRKSEPVSEDPNLSRDRLDPARARAGTPTPVPASATSLPAADDSPVSVEVGRTERESPSRYRVPSAPTGFGAARWVAAGELSEVAGINIPGGLVYIGSSLPTPSGSNDPCLLDPSRSVASSGDYTERQTYYWPSYSEISPTARRAYLEWLHGGRKDPDADIGYVFLFFYGLERRAIIDASNDPEARKDWPIIAAELRRLLSIYGERSGSLRAYASGLLDWVSLANLPSRLYEQPVPEFPRSYELPLYLRLALGQAAVDGTPVPVHLALAWVRLDPNISLRTPALRCAGEFEKLFLQNYATEFGPGLVPPRNRTRLKLVYRPASAGFRSYDSPELGFKGIPDVTVLTSLTKKLQKVVDASIEPLEAYSRWLGRNADAQGALEGRLNLPLQLWPESDRKVLDRLRERVGDGALALSYQELLTTLGATTSFTKDRTCSLAVALEAAGMGFEPDVLAGSKVPKPEDGVVLFGLSESNTGPRADGPYLASALTLQLASAVATSDGEFGTREQDHLREAILSWQHLQRDQRQRLLAHLLLLTRVPASLAKLKRKFEPLDSSMKEKIAAFMATVAQSDGDVSPAEVKMLTRVYKALGIDASKVFTDVHAAAAGKKPTAVTVARVEETGFKLDPARIAALQQDTQRVSALLAGIFTESDESGGDPATEAMASVDEPDVAESSSALLGLEESHSSLARMLLSRPTWSREELLDVAADLELMLDGALEHINEAAFEMHGSPLIEGEDPMTVNPDILEKLES